MTITKNKVDLERERTRAGVRVSQSLDSPSSTPPSLSKGWSWKSTLRTVFKSRLSPHTLSQEERRASQWMVRRKAAMNEMSGVAGGYLVPPEFYARLLNVLEPHSILWDRAQRVPMTSGMMEVPKPNWETSGSSSGTTPTAPWFGGLLFFCGSQAGGATLAETEPSFGQVALRPCDVIGQVVMSNQWINDLDDAGEEEFIKLLGRAAAWYADWMFLRGLGADSEQPVGVINSPAFYAVARAGADHIVQADVIKMAAGMIPSGWTNAIWAVSPSGLEEVLKLTSYQPNQYAAGQHPGQCGWLFGRPLFVTDALPAIGTKGDIIFIDPTLYVIGDRQVCIVDASTEVLFNKQQTVMRVWLRIDGKPLPSGTMTMTNGGTAGAFVGLAVGS